MTKKDISIQVTRKLKKVAVPKDKGNSGLLEYYIYITGVNNMEHTITYYGLFPKSSDKMENLTPARFIATEYIDTRGHVSREDFNNIYNKMTK